MKQKLLLSIYFLFIGLGFIYTAVLVMPKINEQQVLGVHTNRMENSIKNSNLPKVRIIIPTETVSTTPSVEK